MAPFLCQLQFNTTTQIETRIRTPFSSAEWATILLCRTPLAPIENGLGLGLDWDWIGIGLGPGLDWDCREYGKHKKSQAPLIGAWLFAGHNLVGYISCWRVITNVDTLPYQHSCLLG